jgi:hypothetical protein
VAGLVLFAAGLLGESLAAINDRVEGLEKSLKSEVRRQNSEVGSQRTEGRSDE